MSRPLRKHRFGRFVLGSLLTVVLISLAGRGNAVVPAMMNYQGFLTDNSNAPVSGTFPMTFRLYADSTGGSPLWTESYSAVPVTAGVFNVALGRVTPLTYNDLAFESLWLLTTVNGNDILPRRPFRTSAYAFVADSAVISAITYYADSARTAAVADYAVSSGGDLWTATGADIYRASGLVGIGTTGPSYNLDVYAPGGASAGQMVARFQSSRSGTSDGTYIGLWDNTGGTRHTTANLGSVNGNLVLQTVGGNVGIGTTTPSANAVLHAAGTVGGGSMSTYMGVLGTGPFAIVGEAPGGIGYGGYFVGDVSVSGILYGPSLTFRIDHPLEPANKYLSHGSVESPDMKNIYDGVAITDGAGFATVDLPDYCEALNRDFRYQLTVIGGFAQAVVSSEIRGNRFTIRTDKPGVKVSWQVTGIRQDAYAKAHPMVVEEEKRSDARGRFLHPELFGQPREEAIGYRRPRGVVDSVER